MAETAVMEFISKIGQIIIKARTVSPTITLGQTPTTTATAAAAAAGQQQQQKQQQNLEMVLQDMGLWRNSTPVHVNILHSATHVLLERWVISFTPAASTAAASAASSPMTLSPESSSAQSPYTGYLSPKQQQQQQQQQQSHRACSPSASSVTTPPIDTTDLVLLLQSLYTQIRSLPLQSCLTSFDNQTKLAKADLAYSVTSAHEDITQPRVDKTLYSSTQPIVGQQDISDVSMQAPIEEPYTEFTNTLKSTLPLEFVQAASLKIINFEASHMQWGCVRVTGMYDESVGGRIAPENFQDSAKVQKKRHHRSKQSHTTHHSNTAVKATHRQHKEHGLWTSVSQPVKGDTSVESTRNSLDKESLTSNDLSSEKIEKAPEQQSLSVSSTEDQFRARIQSLKRNSDRLFSSLSPSLARCDLADQDLAHKEPHSSVLRESLLPRNTTDQEQETVQPYQFPPPPSPPLSIPLPRNSSVSDRSNPAPSSPSSDLERTPTNTNVIPLQHRQYAPGFQYSPPFVSQQHQHTHHSFSTSPLAHVITRRRSSRLSIVMNCNDDSPDLTGPQSPTASDEHEERQLFDNEQERDPSSRHSSQFRRRDSFQDQWHSFLSESQPHKTPVSQSPSRHSQLRRSSLTPSSVPHGDLFGSLVGSYEESILSGRMSTLPSKPLIFTAQIGVLANQDYKDCPPKLRCPKHVQLEFPAVFYDYESSSRHQLGHHQHHHHSQSHLHTHHSQHHHHSSHSAQFKGAHSFGHYTPISPSSHSLGSYASSPTLNSYFSAAAATANLSSSHGSVPGSVSNTLTHTLPTANDDPILPYVGNLDLDSGFRGARRFARMPGGMRIPLRGQVQVMIKNPNKTVVKVFLVPYDFTDMPAGTKTFLRQKYYSTGPGMGPTTTTTNTKGGGTLRYAIHLQFCCPAPGYVYLYRSIRVVFANRVPDGKESLRVVLEGLGLGSKTLGDNGTSEPSTTLTHNGSRKLEERYVKMRKGEVSFSGSKRKKDQPSSSPALTADGDTLRSSASGLGLGLGLGLNNCFAGTTLTHEPFNPTVAFQRQQYIDHDGMPFNPCDSQNSGTATASRNIGIGSANMDMDVDVDMGVSMDLNNSSHPFSMLAKTNRNGSNIGILGDEGKVMDDDDADDGDYRSIPSSTLIGTLNATKSPPTPTLKQHGQGVVYGTSSRAMSSPSPSSSATSLSTPVGLKETSLYFGTGTMGRKEKSQILGV
ncbi:hypothetical protein BGZ51_003948 [Haplosporangium sp. Z 767]|nr:hypothetical protein BGZ50_003061 [Haplosporangium sp. Z 11]KAF9193199.1 hypothetical protein BGZ51_003948 [Haplosporangium sp. Z 767]